MAVIGTPSSPKLEESEVPLIWKKSCRFKAVHNTLVSGRYQKASPEDGGLTQNKARTSDLTSAIEVVFGVPVKAPRRKLKRPATSEHFKLVGSSMGDSDSSPKYGDVVAPSSLIGMTMEKKVVTSSSPDEILVGKLEAPAEGVVEVTPEANPMPIGVDVEDQVCPSPMPEESFRRYPDQGDAHYDGSLGLYYSRGEGKPRGRPSLNTFTLLCLSGKSGEYNVRVEFDVDSGDDMDVEDEVHPTCGSTICKVVLQYHARATVLIEGLMQVALRQIRDRVTPTDLESKDIDDFVSVVYNESFRGEEVSTS
ncbi:hypothetical protein ACFE04_001909 [Oxalis oulophora]